MTPRLSILLIEHDMFEIRNVLDAFADSPRRDRIRVVQSARDALDHIERHRGQYDALPGLILVDLDLPAKGCQKVLQALQADRELRGIPAIVLTSSCEGPEVLRAYEHGAHSCVKKPFDLEAFHSSARGIEKYWHSLFPIAE